MGKVLGALRYQMALTNLDEVEVNSFEYDIHIIPLQKNSSGYRLSQPALEGKEILRQRRPRKCCVYIIRVSEGEPSPKVNSPRF